MLFLTSPLFLFKQNSMLLPGTEVIVWGRLESPLVNILFTTKLLSLDPLSWDMDCLLTLWPLLIPCSLGNGCCRFGFERLLLNHAKMPGFLAPGGEEFNPGPETRLDRSELLCNKVLLKCKGNRESFWHRHQKGAERVPPASLQLDVIQSLAVCKWKKGMS